MDEEKDDHEVGEGRGGESILVWDLDHNFLRFNIMEAVSFIIFFTGVGGMEKG